jgi:hypothetical protein
MGKEIRSDLIRGVASQEGDNKVVFNYLNASEIWPEKIGGLWRKWPYKRGLKHLFVIHLFLIHG